MKAKMTSPIDLAIKTEQLVTDIEHLKAQYPELVDDAANEAEWLSRITADLKRKALNNTQGADK